MSQTAQDNDAHDFQSLARRIVDVADTKGRAVDYWTSLEVSRHLGQYRVSCIVEDTVLPVLTAHQLIAVLDDRDQVIELAQTIFTEAEDRIREVRAMVEDGRLPADLTSFSDLHDHFDANMLGCAGSPEWFAARPLIGAGVPDRNEAECAAMNCANNAVDFMIELGKLKDVTAESIAPR